MLNTTTADHLRVAKRSIPYAGAPELVALGKAIRKARKRAGMSQEALSLGAEIDRSYLSGIERGEHNVAMMNIAKLAAVMGMNVSQLMIEAGM